jgi:glycosyltransferase involved in cell wall biosynthesis
VTGPNGTRVLHLQKVAGISGSEAHLLSLLPRLRERGWDVRMLMLHENEPGAWDFARALEARGVPLGAMRLRADVDPLAFFQLVGYLARHRPGILHTHLVHADAYGQMAGTLACVPVRFSTKHGFNEFREGPAFAFGDRTVASFAHVHIAISRGLARYLAEREGIAESRFSIVHYGIEAGPEPPPPLADTLALACVGRLVPVKGHETLLRAFVRAREEVPGLTLDIVGDGPLDQELRRRADDLALGPEVRFRGRIAPVQPVYEQAAIVVVPSLGEGFGLVALEAMERGRAVVASAVGGLPEIVLDRETGLLVPPGDPDALATALVSMASDPSRAAAMGAAGRRRAVSAFTQERCTQQTLELYRAALDRAGLS